jgi:hypothetical protein
LKSSLSCVVLPLPSPPSKVIKNPFLFMRNFFCFFIFCDMKHF